MTKVYKVINDTVVQLESVMELREVSDLPDGVYITHFEYTSSALVMRLIKNHINVSHMFYIGTTLYEESFTTARELRKLIDEPELYFTQVNELRNAV